MKEYKRCIVPFLIGTILSVSMGLTIWVGFFFVFIPIGLSVSIGFFLSIRYKNPDLGRKISLSIISLVFFGFSRDNAAREYADRRNGNLSCVFYQHRNFYPRTNSLRDSKSFWSAYLGQRLLRLGLLYGGVT